MTVEIEDVFAGKLTVADGVFTYPAGSVNVADVRDVAFTWGVAGHGRLTFTGPDGVTAVDVPNDRAPELVAVLREPVKTKATK